jgi:hypothetical protein
VRDTLKVARFYLVLLALFTVGRWALGFGHFEYAKAHHFFSIVALTLLSSAFFAAFCRKWRGYTLLQAVMLGMLLGLLAQLVIFASTVLSYALGLHTFFNHPTALNVEGDLPMNDALVRRAFGLLAGPISNGIAAMLGWLMGAALPDRTPSPAR